MSNHCKRCALTAALQVEWRYCTDNLSSHATIAPKERHIGTYIRTAVTSNSTHFLRSRCSRRRDFVFLLCCRLGLMAHTHACTRKVTCVKCTDLSALSGNRIIVARFANSSRGELKATHQVAHVFVQKRSLQLLDLVVQILQKFSFQLLGLFLNCFGQHCLQDCDRFRIEHDWIIRVRLIGAGTVSETEFRTEKRLKPFSGSSIGTSPHTLLVQSYSHVYVLVRAYSTSIMYRL